MAFETRQEERVWGGGSGICLLDKFYGRAWQEESLGSFFLASACERTINSRGTHALKILSFGDSKRGKAFSYLDS